MIIMKFLRDIRIKPFDFVVVVVLFLASFSVLAFLPSQKAGAMAQLRVHGKVVRDFDLNKNQIWTYRAKDGDYNKIEVRNGKIAVIKANCRDQIDVKQGFISKVGQTIVCLPHSLVIQVMSGHKNNEVDYNA
nr:NusG domain II-containing protein [Lactococcus nasutitermitis]